MDLYPHFPLCLDNQDRNDATFYGPSPRHKCRRQTAKGKRVEDLDGAFWCLGVLHVQTRGRDSNFSMLAKEYNRVGQLFVSIYLAGTVGELTHVSLTQRRDEHSYSQSQF